MVDRSELRRRRREVLGLLGGTAGLTFAGVSSVAARGSANRAASFGDSPSGSEGSGRHLDRSVSARGWTQTAKLTADDGDRDDRFGFSVAISGDGSTTIVGGHLDENRYDYEAGSTYVFEPGRGRPESDTRTRGRETTDEAPGGRTTERPTDRAPPSVEEGVTPGFGVGTLLAGLLGTGYLRWREDGDDTGQ